jgi:thiamine biosynthesis lipoprotein
MEGRGFNRDYRTGAAIHSSGAPDEGASYRDVHVDSATRQVTIDRPLTLDLGGLAKGLAIDLAARELQPFENFAIDAGGDLYVAGHNAAGGPWSIGVRHPRRDGEAITRLRIADAAVCTSGDYERQTPQSGHHLIDPRAHTTAQALASVTVIAPTAMLADALATAAFVLGPVEGLRLLERHGVDGLMYSPALDRFASTGISRMEDRG